MQSRERERHRCRERQRHQGHRRQECQRHQQHQSRQVTAFLPDRGLLCAGTTMDGFISAVSKKIFVLCVAPGMGVPTEAL
jgi:hypothetical protein